MERLYFAYGSNMALARMFARCPLAKEIDRVKLVDWSIQFRRVLTIVEEPGACVLGGLYSITADDELALDSYEGWPRYYDKHMVTVESTEHPGKTYEAMVYILDKELETAPDDYYLAVCLEGCRDWSIPRSYMIEAVRKAQEADKGRAYDAQRYYRKRKRELKCSILKPDPKFRSRAEVDEYMEGRLRYDKMLLASFDELFAEE
jgi:gamma-glutamylcyclotransferase